MYDSFAQPEIPSDARDPQRLVMPGEEQQHISYPIGRLSTAPGAAARFDWILPKLTLESWEDHRTPH